MSHETVFEALGAWVKKPLDKLPLKLRPIAVAYVSQWEALTPAQRTDRAIEVDRQHGLMVRLRHDRHVKNLPDLTSDDLAEYSEAWQLSEQLEAVQLKIDEVNSLKPVSHADAVLQETRRANLVAELAMLNVEGEFKSTPHVVIGGATVIKHSTKPRRDTLTPVIELAQKECNNKNDTAEVWNALKLLAEKKTSPFYGCTEEGLQYVKGDDAAIFTRKSLGKRLTRKGPLRPGKTR